MSSRREFHLQNSRLRLKTRSSPCSRLKNLGLENLQACVSSS